MEQTSERRRICQNQIGGIHHFQSSLFSSQRELFERLAEGQHPETLFITGSDLGVNPNLVTQTEPGELIIVRNAGDCRTAQHNQCATDIPVTCRQ